MAAVETVVPGGDEAAVSVKRSREQFRELLSFEILL